MQNDIPDIFKKTPAAKAAADLQRRADSVIDMLRPQYVAQTQVGVAKLTDWVAALPDMTSSEQEKLIAGDFFRTAHDIKGQGATFGFPLMTTLGDHICRRIKVGAPFTSADIHSFAADIADMRTVLEKELTGDGGATGQNIRNRLGES